MMIHRKLKRRGNARQIIVIEKNFLPRISLKTREKVRDLLVFSTRQPNNVNYMRYEENRQQHAVKKHKKPIIPRISMIG
ncbi:MAG: hypothetical protein MHMPM18_005066 [Marteilia pararefringens]